MCGEAMSDDALHEFAKGVCEGNGAKTFQLARVTSRFGKWNDDALPPGGGDMSSAKGAVKYVKEDACKLYWETTKSLVVDPVWASSGA